MAPNARSLQCRTYQSQSSLSRHGPPSSIGLYRICGILTAKCQAVSWATSNRDSLSPVLFCRNLYKVSSQTKQRGVRETPVKQCLLFSVCIPAAYDCLFHTFLVNAVTGGLQLGGRNNLVWPFDHRLTICNSNPILRGFLKSLHLCTCKHIQTLSRNGTSSRALKFNCSGDQQLPMHHSLKTNKNCTLLIRIWKTLGTNSILSSINSSGEPYKTGLDLMWLENLPKKQFAD